MQEERARDKKQFNVRVRLVVVGTREEKRGVTGVEAEDERSKGDGRGMDAEEGGEGVGRVPLGSSHCATEGCLVSIVSHHRPIG